MDRPRPAARLLRRRFGLAGGGLAALAGLAWGVARLDPAAPAVDRGQLYLAEVREGRLDHKVRGPGLLQPREARWLATPVEARAERILARPGTAVQPDTVIVELSNPELRRAADSAEFEVAAARADLAALRLALESERLDREAALAEARAGAEAARLQAEAEGRAWERGAVSELQYTRTRILARQLAGRVRVEEQRRAAQDEAMHAQLAARQARLRQLERDREERVRLAESLRVRAGMAGIVQSVSVQEGRQVAAGASVARVARPDVLYAELRIAELDAREVAVGQAAVIDLRDGVASGRVVHVDPAVVSGAVRIEVDFDGPLPGSARADLGIDGAITIATVERVRYVGRPAGAQAGSATTVFRVRPGASTAERVPVRFGSASAGRIEVVAGLEPGDLVALADTTQWSGHDRLAIN